MLQVHSCVAETDPRRAVELLLREHRGLLLAVSGGLDSMCLLELAFRCRRPDSRIDVATFDHRSGPHGAAAVELVRRVATARGLPFCAGIAATPADSEAAWRHARWTFLRAVAAERNAVIVTAHTMDDHLETVVMRILRRTGTRGLAGLLVPVTGVARPLVNVARATLERFASEAQVRWIDDPTNRSFRHVRNRVRLDLLPALRMAVPTLPDDLMALSCRAAEWRRYVDRLSSRWLKSANAESLSVGDGILRDLPFDQRAIAWQSVLAQNGIVLDHRGLSRIASLDGSSRTGHRVQLSGGWQATRLRGEVIIEPLRQAPLSAVELHPGASTPFGPWVFRSGDPAQLPRVSEPTPWEVWVPADCRLVVREWAPGDRLRLRGSTRRVTRFLAEAGIAGPQRRGWPVVTANGEIVWVPGVRRAHAAPVRSGRPVCRLVCERLSS
ncbi:MAG: tRNA lysidine(34) synthetase TilS [Gemmatimonadaceae bacterium]